MCSRVLVKGSQRVMVAPNASARMDPSCEKAPGRVRVRVRVRVRGSGSVRGSS